MKSKRLFVAIGNIDERFIDEDAEEIANLKNHSPKRVFYRFAGLAACAAVLLLCVWTISGLFNTPNNPDGIVADGGPTIQSPSLSLDNGSESAASYVALENRRGRLQAGDFVLAEEVNGLAETDRIVFRSLEDFIEYTDAFVLIANVHEVAPDGDNMQSSIAEYAMTIGDQIRTKQWDDYTVSTGSRVLIRQQLIGGCSMDEPNNLLRVSGVYVLPIRFNEYWGAYEVVGDLDVLFELDDMGKMVSHSRWEGLNQYDGMTLSDFLDVVQGLYPQLENEFMEQPIHSIEQAENQVIIAYNASGFRKFEVDFDSETVVKGADVYLFKISFNYGSIEYAAIAKENGAFIRGEMASDGELRIFGGLGSFPKR
ncbi:MAG: hypothetical protein LBH28_07640 [Oscillospiraceae bacterium]|jgi:hypothetical protein|nr:hypothetical protein [Oscillospiraceae bacterium]